MKNDLSLQPKEKLCEMYLFLDRNIRHVVVLIFTTGPSSLRELMMGTKPVYTDISTGVGWVLGNTKTGKIMGKIISISHRPTFTCFSLVGKVF